MPFTHTHTLGLIPSIALVRCDGLVITLKSVQLCLAIIGQKTPNYPFLNDLLPKFTALILVPLDSYKARLLGWKCTAGKAEIQTKYSPRQHDFCDQCRDINGAGG